MRYILFYIVILISNIIQGITGFAGTILAMPPSLLLVGFNTAKPILNVLGILAGVYVFATQWNYVNWKELRKVVIVMAVGILSGIFLKGLFLDNESILYKILGVVVIMLAVQGFVQIKKPKQDGGSLKIASGNSVKSYSMLLVAGIVHGMFVCGGPLLIGYLSKVIKEKANFRATISTIWIILNGIILLDDIKAGYWTVELVYTQLISIPFLIAGIIIGTKLYKNMSQLLFMKITYILLFISGTTLLVK